MNDTLLLRGKVWRYGDGVNTDVLFPGKYTYTLRTQAEIAAHALEDLDPRFMAEAQPGDIIIAGRNWGNGSSREQAVTCLKYRGIAAVIAKSFARIYYRNGINQGMLFLTCPELVEAAQSWDVQEPFEGTIDLPGHQIRLNGQSFAFPALSAAAIGILQAGGLLPYTQRKLGLPVTEMKMTE